MNTSLSEAKIQAPLLLKNLRSNKPDFAETAAIRLQRLTPFKSKSPTEIVGLKDSVQLKHALEAVAREHGYLTWKKLKDAKEAVWRPGGGGFMHNWCKTYVEAKDIQEKKGGYLLPYLDKFYLCEWDYIAYLGLDPLDTRWAVIDYDAARPNNTNVYTELENELRSLQAQ